MAYEFNIAEAINVIRDLVGPDRRKARKLGLEGMEGQNQLTGAQTRQADATTERISSMTPAEIAQLNAQTELAGAQTEGLQGAEGRAGRREQGDLLSLELDNMIKKYTADNFPEMSAAQIESLLAGSEASRGQGAYYLENANAVQPRLTLERDELTQRGRLGRGGLKNQERGVWADVLRSATTYPYNEELARYAQLQLGFTPSGGAGGGADDSKDRLRRKLEGYFDKGQSTNPSTYESTGPFTPGVFGGGGAPGAASVATGVANNLYSGLGGKGRPAQPRSAAGPAKPKAQPNPRQTPIGQGPPADAAMAQGQQGQQILHWLRNLLDSAGIKR